ncbi:MAG: hypothetical protein ACRESZ_18925 [Methylococcales bacterium]
MTTNLRKPRVSLLLVVSWVLLYPRNLSALDLGIGDWQAHGFASQGYTYTSGNNFFGSSSGNGSLNFTETGVNVLGHLQPNLLIAAQGLYRDAGGSDNDNFRLDFANLDYHLSLDEHSTVGIRLGRVKIPFGIYNETRDVIWTRPGVTLPQSVYFDALGLRQAFISSDGGLAYGRYTFGDHAISAEMVVSEPRDNTSGTPAFLTGLPNADGRMSGNPILVGRMGYQWREGRFRLLFSVVNVDRNFTSFSPSIPSGSVKAFYPLASTQLNLEDWSFTAEYGQVALERSGFFFPSGTVFKNTSENFYLQTEYRFTPSWTALLRFDAFFANINDRGGKRTAQLTGLPRHRFFAEDITFGLRWTYKDFLVAADYHRVYGTAWLSPVDNPDLARGLGDARWDLLTLMASYRF